MKFVFLELFLSFPHPPHFLSGPTSEACEAHIGKSSCCGGAQWSLRVSPKDSRTSFDKKTRKPIHRNTSENVKADVCLLRLCLQPPGRRQSLRSDGQEVSGNIFLLIIPTNFPFCPKSLYFPPQKFSEHQLSPVVVDQLCSLLGRHTIHEHV